MPAAARRRIATDPASRAMNPSCWPGTGSVNVTWIHFAEGVETVGHAGSVLALGAALLIELAWPVWGGTTTLPCLGLFYVVRTQLSRGGGSVGWAGVIALVWEVRTGLPAGACLPWLTSATLVVQLAGFSASEPARLALVPSLLAIGLWILSTRGAMLLAAPSAHMLWTAAVWEALVLGVACVTLLGAQRLVRRPEPEWRLEDALWRR